MWLAMAKECVTSGLRCLHIGSAFPMVSFHSPANWEDSKNLGGEGTEEAWVPKWHVEGCPTKNQLWYKWEQTFIG